MNPQYPVTVIEGQWNKIASGVTHGTVHRHGALGQFLQTYRIGGQAAPTTANEGEPAFTDNHNWEPIKNTDAIDVYIWPSKTSELRVDV